VENAFEIEVSLEQRKLLDEHLRLVLEFNDKLNLTRITDWDQAQLLHVEDSLAGLGYLQAAPEGLYTDMGSGGGFPGISLAITSQRQTTLIESVKKKAAALEQMVAQLGLAGQVEVSSLRVEELASERPGAYAVVTARALSALPSLLELASPLLKPQGVLICYKGAPEPAEVDQAAAIASQTGLALEQEVHYTLSDESTPRSLYIYRKISEPTVKLPRRIGLAQKRPLR